MPNVIPGTPFADILAALRNAPRRSNRLRDVAQRRVVAPINSTLSSLTPQQLAVVGIIASNSDRPIRAALNAIAGDNLVDPERFNPDAPGVFGQAGVQYQIEQFNQPGNIPVSGIDFVFGPITPSVVTGEFPPFPPFNAWRFDAFAGDGTPIFTGGTSVATRFTWEPGTEPHTFEIREVANPGTVVQATPGTADPIVIPQPEPLPPVQDERRVATGTDIQRLEDGQDETQTALDVVVDTVTEIAEEIAENLDCNVCALLTQILADLLNLSIDTEANFTAIENLLLPPTSFSVELAPCDEESDVQTAMGDGIAGLAAGLGRIADKLNVMHIAACNGESQLYGIPEDSFTRKTGVTPQAILKVLESDPGPTGRAYTRPIRLPNFDDVLSGPFPEWTRGDWRTTAFATNGTKIVLFASSMSAGASIVLDLASRCAGFENARIVSEFVPGAVSNPTLLRPFVAQLFPNGTGNNSLPTETFRFLQDRRITTV